MREWAGAGFTRDLAQAAEACPLMDMAYGPTPMSYTVTVEPKDAQTRLLLTAKESGQAMTEMLLAASESSGSIRLVRVMNSPSLGEAEKTAVELASAQ
ncbi:hypothetical protein [Streptomyces sp. NPDC059949]|uniref:hypothetical protein n=1 Tax=Streptomyces sp. NPDC059949 TaxID=3347013 RepID=UPI00366478C7